MDGSWTLDERSWLPARTRIDPNYCCDFDDATEGLSFDVMHILESVSKNGVPDDVSHGYVERWREFLLHCQEELLGVPIFTWVLIKDVLDLNWKDVVEHNPAKGQEIDLWVQHLHGLGSPEDHRVICCTYR